jgi:hypothetical protein
MALTLEETIQGFIDNSRDVTAANTLRAAFQTASQIGLFDALRAIQPEMQIEHFSAHRTGTDGLGIDIVYLDKIPGRSFSRLETIPVLTVEGDEITAFSGFAQVKATKGEDIAPVVEAVRTSKQRMMLGRAYSSCR